VAVCSGGALCSLDNSFAKGKQLFFHYYFLLFYSSYNVNTFFGNKIFFANWYFMRCWTFNYFILRLLYTNLRECVSVFQSIRGWQWHTIHYKMTHISLRLFFIPTKICFGWHISNKPFFILRAIVKNYTFMIYDLYF